MGACFSMGRAAATAGHEETQLHRNEVVLVGRVSADPVEFELPSGSVIATLRLVVRRPAKSGRQPEKGPTVDTIDCTGWLAGPRRSMLSLHAGDTVEIAGAVRRRFWRAGKAPASRYEVEVAKVRRIARGQLSA